MALTGSLHFTAERETEEIITGSVTHPADLPEDHVNYDKRGTTEITSHSVWETYNSSSITGSYTVIDMVGFHNDGAITGTNDRYRLFVHFKTFASEQTRLDDWNGFIYEGDHQNVPLIDITEESLNNQNILAYAYDFLKTQDGWGDLTDA